MKAREVIKLIEAAGWYEARSGNHRIWKHPNTNRICPVPVHSKEIPTGTLRSIEKITGVRLRK